MDLLVASIENQMKFDVEIALEKQLGAQPLPFPGMDKSTAAVCEFYPEGICMKGANCPFRHVRGDRSVVCKHWLRGLCKKGDGCEFLHEYDMTKMPECYFYSRFNACHNKECPFLHIDPESKLKDCPWYDRGFCRHGQQCRHRHVRRVLCMNFLAGFCPDGKTCKFVHPKFELPALDDIKKEYKKGVLTCHYCGELGHKVLNCPNMGPDGTKRWMKTAETTNNVIPTIPPPFHQFQVPLLPSPKPPPLSIEQQEQLLKENMNINTNGGPPLSTVVPYVTKSGSVLLGPPRMPRQSLDEVVCYKCGSKGHYANKCPKGPLAFLSQSANLGQTTGLMRR